MLTSSEWLVTQNESGPPFLRSFNSLLHQSYFEVITLCTKIADTNVEAVTAKEKPKTGTAAGSAARV